MSTISPASLLLLPPWLQLMRLMYASLLVLPLSASLVLLMDCLKVRAVILMAAELVEVVAIYAAGVPPCRLNGDAVSHNSSRRVGVGAGEDVGVDLRHHRPNVC